MAHFKRHKPKRDSQTVKTYEYCRWHRRCSEWAEVSANGALRLPYHDRKRAPLPDPKWGV